MWDVSERSNKLEELSRKYPELERALEIARHVSVITNVRESDESVSRRFLELEEMLKVPFRKESNPRRLSLEEIEELASRPAVRQIVVENYLATLPLDIGVDGNLANLYMCAWLRKWNMATVAAILDGIMRAFKKSNFRVED